MFRVRRRQADGSPTSDSHETSPRSVPHHAPPDRPSEGHANHPMHRRKTKRPSWLTIRQWALLLLLVSTVGMLVGLGVLNRFPGRTLSTSHETEATLLRQTSGASHPAVNTTSRGLHSHEPVVHAHQYTQSGLSPLMARDYHQFTVRINTWQRTEQLELVIHHYLSCRSVAQVQVVWCLDQGAVPQWLNDWERSNTSVAVERHSVNSLNARFDVSTASTRGILSTDDDVLRPCLALEAAFVQWTRNPNRQVGFDARSHGVVDNDSSPPHWTYAYMSTTEQTNLYSLTLTRHSFQHVDYLASYTHRMPVVIRDFVTTHLNCEDVAMSFWISSLTNGQPPLLADAWAVKSQIKLYVPTKISGGSSHKAIRDECVDQFANVLHLKQRLNWTRLRWHDEPYFAYGSRPSNWNALAVDAAHAGATATWYSDLTDTVTRWKQDAHSNVWMSELAELRRLAAKRSFDQGLIESTSLWKKRFKKAT